MITEQFYSNGKLLISGEYVVLDGAAALALPTTLGQHLTVTPNSTPWVLWKSLDADGSVWFESTLDLHKTEQSNDDVKNLLFSLLKNAQKLNPDFIKYGGVSVETKLTFPRNFGLGSSSTLIANIAKWANVDPFELLKMSFSGSGYDIACAIHNNPIIYRLNNDNPKIELVDFNPSFKDSLFFIYLNKKQNSRDGIARYRSSKDVSQKIFDLISRITTQMTQSKSIFEFEGLINDHETIISKIIGLPTIKEQLFKDYSGAVKSLGAWGGDFILVTGNEKTPDYFKEKGFEVIFKYDELILQ